MKNGRGLKLLIALLVIALIAVAAVIVFKEYEYGVSEQFYDNLRGLMRRAEGLA